MSNTVKSDAVNSGDKIIYNQSDCGRVLDEMGLVLVPDEILTVGEDVDIDFASRLVEDHVCRVLREDGPAAETTPPSGPGDAAPPAAVAEPIADPPAGVVGSPEAADAGGADEAAG